MKFLPPGEHLCWCLTSTDSFLSPNRTVKCWKASDHCCHIQKLPKTNFLFFIPGFDNKSKKKGESYIEKYWSEYRIIIYFYRIFVVFLAVSSLRALLVVWKECYKNTSPFQSCFLPFEFALQNMELIIQITFPLPLHGSESPKATSALLCLFPCTLWTQFEWWSLNFI